MTRSFLSYLAAAIVCAFSVVSVQAGTTKQIEWKDLVPSATPLKDPLSVLTPDQRFEFENITWARELGPDERFQNKMDVEAEAAKSNGMLAKQGIDVEKLYREYNEWREEVEKRGQKVVAELNDTTIRMAGYLLPLEFNEEGDKQFLLVPYVGACIHAPPPPMNQIVYVETEKPFKVSDLYAPVWITGKLKTERLAKSLSLVDGTAQVDVGYALNGDSIEEYKE